MSFHAFEDYGIYGHGPRGEKSVPKQRTTADDWSRLSEEDREDVKELRRMGTLRRVALADAMTYMRRHG